MPQLVHQDTPSFGGDETTSCRSSLLHNHPFVRQVPPGAVQPVAAKPPQGSSAGILSRASGRYSASAPALEDMRAGHPARRARSWPGVPRHLLLAALALAALLSLVGLGSGIVNVHPSTPSSSALHTTISPASAQACHGERCPSTPCRQAPSFQHCNQVDPYDGNCVTGARTIAQANVKDQHGQVVGEIDLRYSAACKSAWARLIPYRGYGWDAEALIQPQKTQDGNGVGGSVPWLYAPFWTDMAYAPDPHQVTAIGGMSSNIGGQCCWGPVAKAHL